MGRILRFPLRFIPRGAVVRILQGRLKGKRWVVGSGLHGCWLGSYEYEKITIFEKTVAEGSTVYDIGAHVGFYTLLASELVGPNGRVFAFEPLPENLRYLRRHLELNQIENVTVMEAAVSNRCGIASFEEGRNTHEGCISPAGNLCVAAVALDEMVAAGELPAPDYIKMDIEGAEALALTGARTVLAGGHPVVFVATHGADVHEECLCLLESLGYDVESIGEDGPDRGELIAKEKVAQTEPLSSTPPC